MTTIKQAQLELKRIDWQMRRIDGEFQVKPRALGWDDAKVYLTNDIDDAVGTAKLQHAADKRQSREDENGTVTQKIEAHLGIYGYTLADMPDGLLPVALDVLLNGVDGAENDRYYWEKGVLDMVLNLTGAKDD